MRIDKFLIAFIASVALIFLLNKQLGSIPPLGKFLDPVHGYMANAETEKDLASITLNNITLETPADPATSGISGSVYFDDRLVPHIFGADDQSVYFLQGYVHAKYRLWQMETQTRAASGRLSEILGPDLLNFDREKRRTGMVAGAENALKELEKDHDTYSCILAYTAGINEYIHSELKNSGDKFIYASLPLEFKLLNYEPETWTPLKSMLLLKYMANTLTGYDNDIEYTNIIKKIGRNDFDLLFPDRPQGIDPIIPSEKVYDYVPAKIDTAMDYDSSGYYKKLDDRKTESDGVGSNNWAVAPAKTKNGHAILCNDPHLQLNLPSLWYEVQLSSPEQNVYGASLPGAPGVIIGFNDSISWGVTHGGRDVRDWYKVTWRLGKREEYRYNNGWEKIEKRVEVIKVKGDDDFIDTVYWTVHGPMVYTDFGEDKGDWENLAMRWAAIDPSNEFKTFYLLNRAKNYDEYRNALQYFSCPAQNFVFAATSGDIAITQQGKLAVKWPEQGRFVLDGKDAAGDWQNYIPWEENPFIKNPSRGFVSSANQHPTDSTYPYYYTGSDFEFFRNRRINDLLGGMQNITVEDLEHLQQDNFNYIASEVLPIMLKVFDGSDLNNGPVSYSTYDKPYMNLEEWNYMNDPDITAPTFFQIWWDELNRMLWDEFHNEDTAFIIPDEYYTILALKTLPVDYKYFDIDSTKVIESRNDIILKSFKSMTVIVDSLAKETGYENFEWYKYKHTNILHLAQLPAFSSENIHNGGYRHIVNATSGRNGPSWRMVVEMSDPVHAYGVYPGGQSGNPGSKYYDNFISDWAAGKYFILKFFRTEEKAKENSMFTITFK